MGLMMMIMKLSIDGMGIGLIDVLEEGSIDGTDESNTPTWNQDAKKVDDQRIVN